MLARGTRTVSAGFDAPLYWVELWAVQPRRVRFAGVEATLRHPDPSDEVGAVRDPCPVERALIAAVGDMRKVGLCDGGWWSDRWAASVAGWRGYAIDGPPPAAVVAAIEGAYPLPKSFGEAHDEMAYWAWRTCMMAAVLDEGVEAVDALREPELDLVTQVRVESVRRLLTVDARASSIDDVATRLSMYAMVEGRDHAVEAAMARDLAQLMRLGDGRGARADVAATSPLGPDAAVRPPAGRQRPRDGKRRVRRPPDPAVSAALRADPSRPDRQIARALKCHPATVGAERLRLGLRDVPRRVLRGNSRPYWMRRPATSAGASASPALARTSTPYQGDASQSEREDQSLSHPCQLDLPWN